MRLCASGVRALENASAFEGVLRGTHQCAWSASGLDTRFGTCSSAECVLSLPLIRPCTAQVALTCSSFSRIVLPGASSCLYRKACKSSFTCQALGTNSSLEIDSEGAAKPGTLPWSEAPVHWQPTTPTMKWCTARAIACSAVLTEPTRGDALTRALIVSPSKLSVLAAAMSSNRCFACAQLACWVQNSRAKDQLSNATESSTGTCDKTLTTKRYEFCHGCRRIIELFRNETVG